MLTDGQSNYGSIRLEYLINIDRSGGIKTGVDMALETEHDIQIFFIGIGDGADLDIGRFLAEATGAEFQGIAEDDLANLLEELAVISSRNCGQH